MNSYLVASFAGYFLGSFQTAYFLGKIINKIDIREHGTNNAGASNVTTVMGWKYGVATALVDILKGIVAVLFIRFFFSKSDIFPFIAGSTAVLGHIFPYYLGFRGGKGLATMLGMTLAYDYRIGLILFLVVLIITIVTDYIALGAIVMYSLFPILTLYFGHPIEGVYIGITLALIAYFKHYGNFIRIKNNEESGLRAALKKRK